MSDPAPNQGPKTQPKRSGGPPGPPKITARGLEDGAGKNPDPIPGFIKASGDARRLMELLESIRGSRLHALNMLEQELDLCIVQLSKLFELLDPELREVVTFHLKTMRDYRARYPRLETGDSELRMQAQKLLAALGSPEVQPSCYTRRRRRGLFAFLASLGRRE
jgi:hypothetical protein